MCQKGFADASQCIMLQASMQSRTGIAYRLAKLWLISPHNNNLLLQTLSTQRYRQPATLVIILKGQLARVCMYRRGRGIAVQQQLPMTFHNKIKLTTVAVTIARQRAALTWRMQAAAQHSTSRVEHVAQAHSCSSDTLMLQDWSYCEHSTCPTYRTRQHLSNEFPQACGSGA